jgi:hypothetical protein
MRSAIEGSRPPQRADRAPGRCRAGGGLLGGKDLTDCFRDPRQAWLAPRRSIHSLFVLHQIPLPPPESGHAIEPSLPPGWHAVKEEAVRIPNRRSEPKPKSTKINDRESMPSLCGAAGAAGLEPASPELQPLRGGRSRLEAGRSGLGRVPARRLTQRPSLGRSPGGARPAGAES